MSSMNVFLDVCLVLLSVSLASCSNGYSNISSSADSAVWSGDPSENAGPWSGLLEEWAVGSRDHRQERILKLPNTSGYYISNRVDTPPTPQPIWSQEYNPPTPGKVANRPAQYTNYPKQKPTTVSEGPARKEVSETDLYLLGAIEKLVFRVDFMEKRLKKAEELIYYLMAGGNKKNPEPCPKDFTRAGVNCYHFSVSQPLDWKAASDACKGMKATLAEMETIEENQDVVTFVQATPSLRGKDFWTGGLNPGLLWIWSNSARPVSNGKKNETQLLNSAGGSQDSPISIKGNGRCLKLAYNPSIRSYYYLGSDCAARQHYVCEILDKTLSNQIQRISRELKLD